MSNKSTANLETVYMGLKLKNPIIVSSSGLTKSVSEIKKCEDAGSAAVVVKSIFEEQIQLEIDGEVSKSRGTMWHPEAAEYIDQYAAENAVEQYVSVIREAKKTVSIPVIASIHCVSVGKWVEFTQRLERAGADAIELNLFIMPSDPDRTSIENEQIYFDVVREVKKIVSIPVSLKVGFYFSSLTSTLSAIGNMGIDGLVLFNRFHAPDFDIKKLQVISANTISHPSEYSRSLRWISILSPLVKCDLCASTGVHDGASAIKQILAGASAVQLCSTLYENGLGKIEEIKNEIENWMIEQNFETVDSFKGRLSIDKNENPAQIERVQFMKTSVSV